MVTRMNWRPFVALYSSQRKCNFFDRLLNSKPVERPQVQEIPRADVIKKKLAAVLETNIEDIDFSKPLIALGLDSLMAVELVTGLENAGIQVSLTSMFTASSVNAWMSELTGTVPVKSKKIEVEEKKTEEKAIKKEVPQKRVSAKISEWLHTFEEKPSAEYRLICFPYAGGGPSVFNKWMAELGPNVEISSIVLPGRMHRLNEAPLLKMDDVVEQLTPALAPLFDKKVIFFGHCLGALVMHEVAQLLFKQTGKMPFHIFVSGARAPQFYTPEQLEIDVLQFSPVRGVPGHELDQENFIEFLKDLNFDTSAAIFNNLEMREIMIPTVQADLRVNNLYTYQTRPKLDVPITVIGGRVDPYVAGHHLLGWKQRTSASFEIHMRGGDHYFIERERAFLVGLVDGITCSSPEFT